MVKSICSFFVCSLLLVSQSLATEKIIHIQQVAESSPDKKIMAIFADLKSDHDERQNQNPIQNSFFSMGGIEGQIFRITDPKKASPPFLIGDSSYRSMNQKEADKFCAERGAKLPSKSQFETLLRALSKAGKSPFSLGDRNSFFWSSTPDSKKKGYFSTLEGAGKISQESSEAIGLVRCAK